MERKKYPPFVEGDLYLVTPDRYFFVPVYKDKIYREINNLEINKNVTFCAMYLGLTKEVEPHFLFLWKRYKIGLLLGKEYERICRYEISPLVIKGCI